MQNVEKSRAGLGMQDKKALESWNPDCSNFMKLFKIRNILKVKWMDR